MWRLYAPSKKKKNKSNNNDRPSLSSARQFWEHNIASGFGALAPSRRGSDQTTYIGSESYKEARLPVGSSPFKGIWCKFDQMGEGFRRHSHHWCEKYGRAVKTQIKPLLILWEWLEQKKNQLLHHLPHLNRLHTRAACWQDQTDKRWGLIPSAPTVASELWEPQKHETAGKVSDIYKESSWMEVRMGRCHPKVAEVRIGESTAVRMFWDLCSSPGDVKWKSPSVSLNIHALEL